MRYVSRALRPTVLLLIFVLAASSAFSRWVGRKLGLRSGCVPIASSQWGKLCFVDQSSDCVICSRVSKLLRPRSEGDFVLADERVGSREAGCYTKSHYYFSFFFSHLWPLFDLFIKTLNNTSNPKLSKRGKPVLVRRWLSSKDLQLITVVPTEYFNSLLVFNLLKYRPL